MLTQEFFEASEEIRQRGGDDSSRSCRSTTKIAQIPKNLVGGANFPGSRLATMTMIQKKSVELLLIQPLQCKPATFEPAAQMPDQKSLMPHRILRIFLSAKQRGESIEVAR